MMEVTLTCDECKSAVSVYPDQKASIAKCTICSNTKSVLKGTQGLNSHIKARHPNIFESFKENLMPLENIKTPSSKYILAQSSKKSFKKTIKKSKCEPSADNKIQDCSFLLIIHHVF